MKMVLYQLAHGIFFERINTLYDVGAFTIKKYTYIVCDVLSNGDKLFSIYVHTFTRNQLFNIIE
jgi:predicted transcriptional regulator YheO